MSFLFLLTSALFLLPSPARAANDGKIHLSYWEKWSGAEQLAMQEVVDEFNHSQNRIVVDFLSVGQIEQKTLLATAGGDPPDIAGVYLNDIYAFADRNALTPLSPFIRADGLTPDQFNSRYARAYAGMGTYGGEVWGVPSTPTTIALYWNKDLFRAAGLDPEKPPRTIADLVSMSKKLTVHDAEGNLTQVGFLPQQQEWWGWAFPLWFGGQIFDGKNITIGTNPINVKCFAWMGAFTKMYGLENIRRLSATFGNLSTPDDPFMSGKVALLFDGVWRYDYIQQFQPGLNFGIGPWPEAVPGIDDFTMADSDLLIIPRGAKHPREAWEFLKYVSSPNLAAQSLDELSGVERLCYLQRKASPLSQWSPFFANHNPNPYIGIFRKLAESPHAVANEKMGIWDEYERDITLALQKVRLGICSPQQALDQCQQRVNQSWQWHQQSLALRKKNATAATP
ncbi:MAG TPA: ABC transporter substrate-binding protein [Candidatus Methylacidiphilales bacterium]|nr:ABC transporter substrate-binding protein [Candidatus Methylacidiphilales bacterium]